MAQDITTGKAYLYRFRNNKLEMLEGEITIYRIAGIAKGRFFTGRKALQCCGRSGEVSNRTVWLPKPDEKKARELLIMYEEDFIEDLYDKIDTHTMNIRILKGEYDDRRKCEEEQNA